MCDYNGVLILGLGEIIGIITFAIVIYYLDHDSNQLNFRDYNIVRLNRLTSHCYSPETKYSSHSSVDSVPVVNR